MQVQRDLDADIAMIFDECTPYPATEEEARTSMQLSLRWAGRSRAEFERLQNPHALFGIVQGGMYAGLRQESLAGLRSIGFEGYAIGGLAVGEPKEEREAMLDAIEPHLPTDRPRYLMGVGTPEDLVAGSRARHGHVRLRHADPACAQRPPVRVDRRAQDPQCALRSPILRRSIRPARAIRVAITAVRICGTWTSAARFWPRGSAPSIISTST